MKIEGGGNKEDDLHRSLLALHVTSSYLEYFNLAAVKNKPDCWKLILEEKEDLVPQNLSKRESVLDGFCNDLSVLSHSFSLKKIYLIIRRRRWKPKGRGKHYCNRYNFHSQGAKLTQEFVGFLKGND
jgi:hypothetical protein